MRYRADLIAECARLFAASDALAERSRNIERDAVVQDDRLSSLEWRRQKAVARAQRVLWRNPASNPADVAGVNSERP